MCARQKPYLHIPSLVLCSVRQIRSHRVTGDGVWYVSRSGKDAHSGGIVMPDDLKRAHKTASVVKDTCRTAIGVEFVLHRLVHETPPAAVDVATLPRSRGHPVPCLLSMHAWSGPSLSTHARSRVVQSATAPLLTLVAYEGCVETHIIA